MPGGTICLRYTCLTSALLLLAATTYAQSPVHDNYWPLSGGGALQIHQSARFGPTELNSYRPALVGPGTTDKQALLVHAAATVITARVRGQCRVSGSQEMTVHRPGPILSDGTPAPPDDRWRIYSLSENSKPGDPAWDTWPADLGAPVNADGTPRQYGKQQLWWVMNDLDSSAMREATGNDPLGLEVRVLVWQPRLDGTLFFQYTFINKGRDTLRDAYAAHFVDFDLRDALTDLAAADSVRGLMYAWQRPDYDPEEGVPPAFGACFVQTPRVPSTANDSARWDGAYIREYRNLPVSAITLPVKSSYNVAALSEPGKSIERTPERWHTLARGQALDGAVLDPYTGAPKRFWYDGDPLQQRGWLMDDGISTSGGTAYQSAAGHDPRMMTASGPFDMAPGDTQQVIIAWVFTEAATPEASIHTIRAMADAARTNDRYPVSIPFSSARIDRYENDRAVVAAYASAQDGTLEMTAAGYRGGVRQTGDFRLTPRHHSNRWFYEAELPLTRDAEGMDVHLTLHRRDGDILLPGAPSLPLSGDLRIEGMQVLEDLDYNSVLSRDEFAWVFPRLVYDGLSPLRDLRLIPSDFSYSKYLAVDSIPAQSWYPSMDTNGREGWDLRAGCLSAPIRWGTGYLLYSPVQNMLWYDHFDTPVDSSDQRQTTDVLMEHVAGPSTQKLGVRITDPSLLKNRWYVVSLRWDSTAATLFEPERHYLVADLKDSLTGTQLVHGFAVNGFNGPAPDTDGFRITAGNTFAEILHDGFSKIGAGNYVYTTSSHANAPYRRPVSSNHVRMFGRDETDPSAYPSFVIRVGGTARQMAYLYTDSSYAGMVEVPLQCTAVHRDGRQGQVDVVLSEASPYVSGGWNASHNKLIILRTDYGRQPKAENTALDIDAQQFDPLIADETRAWAAFRMSIDTSRLQSREDTLRIDFYHEVSEADRYRFNPYDGIIVCPGYTPERIAVAQPYPNPTRDWIRLPFDLPQEMHLRADVYDMLGRRIRTLHDGMLPAGSHLLTWDGRDASGTQPPPGSYRIVLSIGGEQRVVPFVLLR